ncbi:hypothetical protein, partial [Ventosimonas gracilis]|uniref:hypothetical protein n=1 Tax=Ventosimonas gracilis TaxID=1680762 RepID=UPI00195633C3
PSPMPTITISDREWLLFAGADTDCFKRYVALKMRRAAQTAVDRSLDQPSSIDTAPSLDHANAKEVADDQHRHF